MQPLITRSLMLAICTLFAAGASAQQTITGSNDGALYEFLVPHPWNGQLIVYAHGYVDPASPIAIPDSPPEQQIYQALTSQGFAVAITSYSQNGWAVKEGTHDTGELRELFTARVGKPARTYLIGASMGGLITVDLVENHPSQYDGALSLCGVVGGSLVNSQHNGDGRVVFDYFFPGVLPGDLLYQPTVDYYTPGSPGFNLLAGTLAAGLGSPGQPTLQFANVLSLPGSNANEIIFSGLLAGTNFSELLGRTHGQNFYDNSHTVYHGSANDAALNAHVRRYHAEEDAVDYYTRFYKPNGELRIPLLTLHTTQDPVVAFSQEALYAAVVAKAGQEERDNPAAASKFLVQQSVNRYGHCNFKPQEILNAFQGLFGWVNYGIKPAGGDVTIP